MQPVVEDNLLPPTDLRPRENTANHNCTIKLTFKLKSSFVCVIYSIPPMRIDTKPMNKQNHTTMGEWTASRLDCKWCSVFLKWMREKRIDLNIQKSFDERLSTYSASIDPIHIQHKHRFRSRTQSTHWPGPIFICIIGWTSSDCVDNLNDIVLVLQILIEKKFTINNLIPNCASNRLLYLRHFIGLHPERTKSIIKIKQTFFLWDSCVDLPIRQCELNKSTLICFILNFDCKFYNLLLDEDRRLTNSEFVSMLTAHLRISHLSLSPHKNQSLL